VVSTPTSYSKAHGIKSRQGDRLHLSLSLFIFVLPDKIRDNILRRSYHEHLLPHHFSISITKAEAGWVALLPIREVQGLNLGLKNGKSLEVFFSTSRQMPGYELKLGDVDLFLQYPFLSLIIIPPDAIWPSLGYWQYCKANHKRNNVLIRMDSIIRRDI
jgi:hypothetical protein